MMPASRPSLAGLFARFLRFGLLAWGGPVAQIALIRRELVEEQQWLSPQRFNRLLAVYQVLPGPEAHELCVHLGMMQRGRLGGILAGIGFMLPGLLLVLALACLYQRLDLAHPLVAAAFLGAQVGVIAVIVRAVHRLGEHIIVDRWLWLVGAVSALASWRGTSFWVVLPAAGLAYAALAARRFGLVAAAVLFGLAVAVWTADPLPQQIIVRPLLEPGPVGALALFLAGLKAGLLTFGGAYTAIPFVRGDAVGRGWVSEPQFLDGLALSGIIPAPLIIFATFVGFLAGGLGGALAITAGIFLPAFAFGLLFYDRLERIVENRRLQAFLAGVAAGVIGLIAVTALQLGINVALAAPALAPAALVFAASLALLYGWRSKFSLPAVVMGSALAGLFLLGASQ